MHESGRHAEVNAIVSRYAARDARADAQRYSWLNPDIRLAAFENDHALLQLLAAAGVSDLARLTLLEVGCGGGGNLLRFLRWGFDPAHLVGNELLPASLETNLDFPSLGICRQELPSQCDCRRWEREPSPDRRPERTRPLFTRSHPSSMTQSSGERPIWVQRESRSR